MTTKGTTHSFPMRATITWWPSLSSTGGGYGLVEIDRCEPNFELAERLDKAINKR